MAEMSADLMFEIGNDQLAKNEAQLAIQWLQKAYETITSCNEGTLDDDATELSYSIKHSLARALMAIPSERARARAWQVIDDMDLGFNERTITLMARLELYSLSPDIRLEDYADCAVRLIRSIHITEATIGTVLLYANFLKAQNTSLALDMLKILLIERLLEAAERKWTEKVLLSIISIATSTAQHNSDTEFMHEILETILNHLETPLEPMVVHASHMVKYRVVIILLF